MLGFPRYPQEYPALLLPLKPNSTESNTMIKNTSPEDAAKRAVLKNNAGKMARLEIKNKHGISPSIRMTRRNG